jgi:hypothetical protein
MSEHLPEPLIFSAWLRAVQDRLIRDELGPLANEITHPEPLFIERVFRDADGAGVWCDVIQSAPVESCEEIARLALDDALVWIDETWGGALEGLRWGDAHEATHDHPVLGDIPVLGALFGSTANATTRTELIVFLTPRVIRNPEDARDVSDELRSRLKSLRPPGTADVPYTPAAPPAGKYPAQPQALVPSGREVDPYGLSPVPPGG